MPSQEPEVVLRTGETAPRSRVEEVVEFLNSLEGEDLSYFNIFVWMSYGRCTVFGDFRSLLNEHGYMEGDNITPDISAIVVAATEEGEGGYFHLSSPYS